MARTMQTARKSTGGKGPAQNGPTAEELTEEGIDVEDLKKQEEIAAGTMQAELEYLDHKYTQKGQRYYAQTVDEVPPEQVNWWEKFALCLTREMDRSNTWAQSTTLQVNSEYLKDILKEQIGSFPGISFQTKQISVPLPPRVLFHYRKELESVLGHLETDSDEEKHLRLLMNFVNEQFKDVIAESENYLEKRLMSFDHLWTIFRPDITVYGTVRGQPRAFTLNSYQYGANQCGRYLALNVSFIDFDGDDFGTRSTTLAIPEFAGAAPIAALSAFPMSFHPTQDDIKKVLIARGRRFEQYAGMHFANYKGIALEQPPRCDRVNLDGRVVIDCKTFHRLNANEAFAVSALPRDDDGNMAKRIAQNLMDEYDDGEEGYETAELVSDTRQTFQKLDDEQRMRANAMVRGFSFGEKIWLDFFVDQLSAIQWNTRCFDQLVLPSAQKNLVKALVSEHSQRSENQFDDIVKGKGKGLILVLHGPPGVGKTLTAECVAEYSKRPLYIVSSGDLGTQSSDLDERLGKILDMASTWKAVLLIDEADVFLERRSLHDMERNALVSIFLRVLEYYEGILFMTSNRVDTFDDAFKSRIHVPLKYGDLPVSSRVQIWKNFLEKVEGGVDVDENGYQRLGRSQLNGRQIKNVIRTAKSLAKYDGQKLDIERLESVVSIQTEFERELDNGMNGNGFDGEVAVNGHGFKAANGDH